jgi:hypothetical protein
MRKFLFTLFLGSLLSSCASLGSKTLFFDESQSIKSNSTFTIGEPNLVKGKQSTSEVQELVKEVVESELQKFNIKGEIFPNVRYDFDKIIPNKKIDIPDSISTDYILLIKLERLTSMDVTRDYKALYKLISVKEKKLIFSSKYNTTFGATAIVLPGIKDYPNTDQLMLTGITSGLYQLKKKLSLNE